MAGGWILLESGDAYLLESGDRYVLEDYVAVTANGDVCLIWRERNHTVTVTDEATSTGTAAIIGVGTMRDTATSVSTDYGYDYLTEVAA